MSLYPITLQYMDMEVHNNMHAELEDIVFDIMEKNIFSAYVCMIFCLFLISEELGLGFWQNFYLDYDHYEASLRVF